MQACDAHDMPAMLRMVQLWLSNVADPEVSKQVAEPFKVLHGMLCSCSLNHALLNHAPTDCHKFWVVAPWSTLLLASTCIVLIVIAWQFQVALHQPCRIQGRVVQSHPGFIIVSI
jgi:hypothetical protein